MVKNGWKWLEFAGNGWKWLEMAGNGWEWLDSPGNDLNWLKIIGNGLNGWISLVLRDFLGPYNLHIFLGHKKKELGPSL